MDAESVGTGLFRPHEGSGQKGSKQALPVKKFLKEPCPCPCSCSGTTSFLIVLSLVGYRGRKEVSERPKGEDEGEGIRDAGGWRRVSQFVDGMGRCHSILLRILCTLYSMLYIVLCRQRNLEVRT